MESLYDIGVSATHNGKSAIKSLLWMFLQTMDVEQHHINMLVLKHWCGI